MNQTGPEILSEAHPEERLMRNRDAELVAADILIEQIFQEVAAQMNPSDPMRSYIEDHLDDRFSHGPRGANRDN